MSLSFDARPLKAVLFDLDDTLHDETATFLSAARHVIEDLAREHDFEVEATLRAYVLASELAWSTLTMESLRSGMSASTEESLASVLTAAGLDGTTLAAQCLRSYREYSHALLELWPGVADLLATLRARGCKLGLITNGIASTHHEKIRVLGLTDAFDVIFIADEVGMIKPDPRLFRLACDRLGVEPKHAGMVGDRYRRDIVGAHEAGLFTIWLDIHEESIPSGSPQPNITVRSIQEAAKFLME